jgi:hypothetical protein
MSVDRTNGLDDPLTGIDIAVRAGANPRLSLGGAHEMTETSRQLDACFERQFLYGRWLDDTLVLVQTSDSTWRSMFPQPFTIVVAVEG